jgi:hypothetical protein
VDAPPIANVAAVTAVNTAAKITFLILLTCLSLSFTVFGSGLFRIARLLVVSIFVITNIMAKKLTQLIQGGI